VATAATAAMIGCWQLPIKAAAMLLIVLRRQVQEYQTSSEWQNRGDDILPEFTNFYTNVFKPNYS